MTQLALIVEDQKMPAMVYARALENAGYSTYVAYTGTDALKHLETIIPDILVLDLNLPDMPGKDILEYVRANSQFAKTQVIIATADALLGNELRSIANLVLVKPISPIQLSNLAVRLNKQAK